MINAMSVDIEEYFQVGAFERTINRADWVGIASRVDYNTRAVMDLFAEAGVSATFFTLGWVAERNPALIRDIVAAGHEIASHGYAHDRVHDLTPDSFRADLRRTKAILEDTGGQAVIGYRAPSFSIGKANAWALDVLAEEGYRYSSSVAPFASDHYGWPGFPRFAHRPVAGSDMIEVPVTTARLGGRLAAAGGGGYFRLLPYALAKAAIRQVNGDGQSAVFYFHPWEVDPEQPRVAGAPLKSRLRHYTNLGVMAAKLRRMLADFRWDRMDRVYL
jgi:polysaccharide deacetylase family protein (PEP-CTERM system associated)